MVWVYSCIAKYIQLYTANFVFQIDDCNIKSIALPIELQLSLYQYCPQCNVNGLYIYCG